MYLALGGDPLPFLRSTDRDEHVLLSRLVRRAEKFAYQRDKRLAQLTANEVVSRF